MDFPLRQLEQRIQNAPNSRERLTALLGLLGRAPNYFEEGNNSNKILAKAFKNLITSVLDVDQSEH